MAITNYSANIANILGNRKSTSDFMREAEEFEAKKRERALLEQKAALDMQKVQKEIETGVSSDDPAAIKEWNAYSQMPPEMQAQYLQMKRADQILNLGGTIAARSPYGGIVEEYPVTPKITETPEYQAAQAGAQAEARLGAELGAAGQLEQEKAAGRAAGEAAGEAEKKVVKAEGMLGLTQLAREKLPKATSGAISNYLYKQPLQMAGISTEQSKADRDLKAIAGAMTSNVPRMEGPQGVLDVELYKQMAGDLGNENLPIEDRLSALETIEQLQKQYAGQPSAPATPDAVLNIPNQAINFLKQNPELREDFDNKYGAGAASKVLGK